MNPTDVLFNGYDLQTASNIDGIITTQVDNDSMPPIRLQDFDLTRQHGGKFVSSWFGRKPIQITGVIVSVTASGLNGRVQDFKKNLYPMAQGTLLVTDALQSTLYNVFISSVTIQRQAEETSRAPFTIQMVCEESFGRSLVTNTFSASGITAASFTVNVTSSGNAPYKPFLRYKMNSGTQLGLVQIANLATGDVIQVNRAMASGEELQIDTENSKIFVNGSGVTYSGIFPSFIATSGINPLKIVTLSGTQNFDFSGSYVPRWL